MSSTEGPIGPIPEHLHTVTPRLVVRDGAAAIDFYREAFAAEELGQRFLGPTGELGRRRRCVEPRRSSRRRGGLPARRSVLR